ncbi:DUF2993 domain-containing protein [Skermania sp. ID1734]|uniref:LmeA family phospholipid-binding protein n=1 Tax=Skermania sp. ID1734 TaxID=2597516 RepID=UPI00117CDCDB|nr:DUF2993 domain-containing protein [Skermania sp. ID1734]TSD99527.1 DUF2993 domain-containing protein [Skermania sp. ID1734]
MAPSTTATSTAPPSKPPLRRRHWVLITAGVIVAALVVALVGGEFYARHTVKSCMSQQFRNELGTNVDIGLSPKPMLVQMLDKDVPYITVDSDDSAFGPAKDMHVHARINDIQLQNSADSSGTIGSSSADVKWSTDGIQSTLQDQSFGALVSAVHSNASDGTLEFDIGPAGLAKLTVHPHISDGTIAVDTVNAEILGLGIPTDLVDGIVKVMSESLQSYPLGMTPKTFQVTDNGIEMTLAGGQYTLPRADQNSQCGGLV